MKTDKLEFVLQDDKLEAPALWGARAILQRSVKTDRYFVQTHTLYLDVLWDRQDIKGDTKEDVTNLLYALNGGAGNPGCLAELRDWMAARPRDFHEDEGGGFVTLGPRHMDHRRVTFHYLPQAGYLYLAAHLVLPGKREVG